MSCLPLASRRIQSEPFGFFQFYTIHITISSATRPRDCVLFEVTYYSHVDVSRNMPVTLTSLGFLMILSWNFSPFPQEVLLTVQDAAFSLMSRQQCGCFKPRLHLGWLLKLKRINGPYFFLPKDPSMERHSPAPAGVDNNIRQVVNIIWHAPRLPRPFPRL